MLEHGNSDGELSKAARIFSALGDPVLSQIFAETRVSGNQMEDGAMPKSLQLQQQ